MTNLLRVIINNIPWWHFGPKYAFYAGWTIGVGDNIVYPKRRSISNEFIDRLNHEYEFKIICVWWQQDLLLLIEISFTRTTKGILTDCHFNAKYDIGSKTYNTSLWLVFSRQSQSLVLTRINFVNKYFWQNGSFYSTITIQPCRSTGTRSGWPLYRLWRDVGIITASIERCSFLWFRVPFQVASPAGASSSESTSQHQRRFVRAVICKIKISHIYIYLHFIYQSLIFTFSWTHFPVSTRHEPRSVFHCESSRFV